MRDPQQFKKVMFPDHYVVRTCKPKDSNAVIQLGDQHKKSLGLLPREAIKKYIVDGNVYGAFDGEELIAYVLFSLPRTEVRITHLCVASDWTGKGLARELVDHIQKNHGSRRGIILHCRRSWPSNGMWSRLNFSPLKAKTGRGKSGEELTVWWRDFGNPDLLSLAADSALTVRAVLDNNVIRDLSSNRAQSDRSYPLLEPSVRSQFQWYCTPGVSNEVNSSITDEHERRLALDYITNNTLLVSPDQSMVNEFKRIIMEQISTSNLLKDGSLPADITLIAEAAAAECELFITNDEKLKTLVDDIVHPLGIRVLLPYQAKMFVDLELNGSEYSPAWLQKSQISVHQILPGESIPLRRFLSTSTGEKLNELKKNFHDLVHDTSGNANELQIITQDGEAIALRYIGRSLAGTIEVRLLRVANSDIENALSRQLLFDLQLQALDEKRNIVVVSDPHLGPSPHLTQWLKKDGWTAGTSTWTKHVSRRIQYPVGDHTKREIIKHEHKHWPEKLLGYGVPNLVVSIKHDFASELLSHDDHLPFTDPLLAMSRDKAYFRSRRIGSLNSGGARLLWYSSGPRGGNIVAASQTVRQRSGASEDVFDELGKFGTLTLEQVKKLAKEDKVTAIVFRNTEIFENPIPLKRMREWLQESGRTPPPFLSPFEISEELFEKVYRFGFGIN
jgi:predicted nucleic acid-binding protein